MRVGIIANPRYPDLGEVLAGVTASVEARGWSLFGDSDVADLLGRPLPPLDPHALDVLLTLGGDGTLLRGAHRLDAAPVPILGLNFGRVGFLTAMHRDRAIEALDLWESRQFTISSRAMLEARLGGGPPIRALNDVVLHKSGVARVVRVQLSVDEDSIGPISSDGIVIASPTGSTAYSLSAGGPVVAPTFDAMIVTPICAHSLSVRPLVVHPTATVSITPLDPHPHGLILSCDGQVSREVAEGDRLTVRVSAHRVNLVRFAGMGFMPRLREKLHWGDLSGRD